MKMKKFGWNDIRKPSWKVPSSKDMELTDADSLYSDNTIDFVNTYYYNEKATVKSKAQDNWPEVGKKAHEQDEKEFLMQANLELYQYGGREVDSIYNNPKQDLQIHCFGDSWTYGWDLTQEKTFTHLLGDKNTSVWNHGGGKTGLDFTVKKLSEVFVRYKHNENKNFVYVITIPHSFRRMYFEESGQGRRTWDKPVAAEVNSYNHYLYFLHHYEIVNRLIGKDRIIWGTWDAEIPKEKIDVFFDLKDYAGRAHPGPKSHKLYAEKIQNVLQERKIR